MPINIGLEYGAASMHACIPDKAYGIPHACRTFLGPSLKLIAQQEYTGDYLKMYTDNL